MDTTPQSAAELDLAPLRMALALVLKDVLNRVPATLPVRVLTQQQRIVKTENGYRTETEIKPAVADQTGLTIGMTMMKLASPVLEVVESQPLLQQRLLVDAAGKEIKGNTNQRCTWLHNCLLARFVRLYLEQCVKVEWQEDAYDFAFGVLKTFLEKPVQYLLVTTALTGIELGDDELRLRPELSIQRLDLAGKQALFDLEGPFSAYGLHEQLGVVHIDHVVQQRLPSGGRKDLSVQRAVQDQCAQLLTALRLMGPGRVSLGKRWSRQEEPYFGIGGGTSYGGGTGFVVGNPTLNLSTFEAAEEEILELMGQVTDIKGDDSLALALRRFETAYDRRIDEDRLIDHWIGLEALFTSTEERSETVDKISRCIGRLLGSDVATRSEVRERARTLYDVRSRVVHGGKPSSKGPKVLAAADEAEQLLRQALRLRLKEHWTIADLETQMMKD